VDDAGALTVVGTTDAALPGQRHRGLSDAFVRRYGPGGALVWTRQFGTSTADTATGVAVDDAGNVYVVGSTRGTFAGQSAMGDRDVYVRSYAPGGALRWTHQFGTIDQDDATGVAVTGDGWVTVVGHTRGTLPGQATSGQNDGFVRQYTAGGGLRWTRQFGSADWDEATAIAGGPDFGEVTVVGWTFGVLAGQTGRGGADAFVRRYGADGSVRWTRQFGTRAEDSAWGVAVDGTRAIVVVGLTAGTLPGKTSAGGLDVFVRTYAPGGAPRWTRQFGTAASDSAAGVAADDAGSVAVVGTTGGRLAGQAALGGGDAFIRLYGPGGSAPWTEQFGTPAYDSAMGVGLGAALDIGIAGQTAGILPGQASRGAPDAFVRRYRP
jgi:hypothetical protein